MKCSAINRSFNQMDDFYNSFASGIVKSSGVMNYIQHLFIALRCRGKGRVLDMCCGRGLLLPLLYNYAPDIVEYTGIDFCREHLEKAQILNTSLSAAAKPLNVHFVHGDVVDLSRYLTGSFDCIIYTSSLEHMVREAGIKSLIQSRSMLHSRGELFLSTPNTVPGSLQYKVHIYEWSDNELSLILSEIGLRVEEKIGLLPTNFDSICAAARRKYGPEAVVLLNKIISTLPIPFLETVLSAPFPEIAKEILYVCKRSDST